MKCHIKQELWYFLEKMALMEKLQSHLQSYRIISKKGLPRLVRSTTAFESEPMGRNKAPDAKIGDRRTDDREKKSAGEKPAEHGRADLGQCLPALG